MVVNRSLSLAVRVAVATAWAGCLVMLGLWFLFDAPRFVALTVSVCRIFGLSCIAAGLFVFMCMVADRLFPAVGRRSSMYRLEMNIFGVALLSFVLAWLLFFYGGS